MITHHGQISMDGNERTYINTISGVIEFYSQKTHKVAIHQSNDVKHKTFLTLFTNV